MSANKAHSARRGVIAYLIFAVLVVGIVYYKTLPALSIHSAGFWGFLFFLDAAVFVSYYIISLISGKLPFRDFNAGQFGRSGVKFAKTMLLLTFIVIVFLIIGNAAGSTMFRAGTYSSLIEVEDMEFSDALEETEHVTDIALMDTASARIIGARTLGTLSDLVSQYDVSYDYTQLAIESDGVAAPFKVAPLEYASFFKWFKNHNVGIPGYVKVDTVEFEAEFVRLSDNCIKYSPSAYFGENIYRALRFRYPTAIFGSVVFEVDDEGNPYWVASVMKPNAGLFGAMDVDSVIIMDACTGETEKYAPAESPEWIDVVYYGDLVCEKFDWYGMLRGGYINSAFSQVNCVVTTDDFGYKIIDNDVYIFTGVTSTSNDEANIGFILANSRTGEYIYLSVPGAEEYSAMSAAEGSVQQYGYRASFPSLINVDGEATYIMVLKDASGIVKMYSMVNVNNYNIVVTSDTQDDVFRKYKSAISADGRVSSSDAQSETITVDEILYIVKDGTTVVYIKSPSGVYSLDFTEDILFVNEGDSVTVSYYEKSDGVTAATLVK